jgi:hypothetical protein
MVPIDNNKLGCFFLPTLEFGYLRHTHISSDLSFFKCIGYVCPFSYIHPPTGEKLPLFLLEDFIHFGLLNIVDHEF